MGSSIEAAGVAGVGVRRYRARAGAGLRSLVVDPSAGPRLPGIQGVRALSAASILLFHVWLVSPYKHGALYRHVYPHLPLGVTMLFVLSSFLLYRPFAGAIMRAQPVPSLGTYLVNRGLRILPAYWFILLFSAFVLETTQLRDTSHQLQTGALDEPVLLFKNALFLQSFAPSTLLTGIGPAWALTDIVVFYAVLPLLVLSAAALAGRVGTRRGRTTAALLPAALLFVTGLSGKLVAGFVVPGGPWSASWHAVIERSFWGHADFFALGIAVAVLRIESEDGRLRWPRWWPAAAVAVMLSIALPTAALTRPEGFADGSVSNYEYDTLMAIVCALFLALVVLPTTERRSVLVRLLERPAIVAVGVVSYSLYLWQLPVLSWLHDRGLLRAGGGIAGAAATAILVVGLPFLLACLTYRFIEYPALRRKARLPRASRHVGVRHEIEPAP